MKCLVCDFGGSSVKYALVDENAVLSKNGKSPAPTHSVEEFCETAGRLFDQFYDEIDGIAISIPGVINPDKGLHLGSGVYSSILKGANVVELLKQRCPTKIYIENDGKCGALAEAWKGALSNVQCGAVLILGTGVGGGVIINGNVLHGLNNSAGEFSFAMTGNRDYSILNEAWMNVGVVGLTYKVCKYKNLDLSVQDAGSSLLKYDQIFKEYFPKFSECPKKIRANGEVIFEWLNNGDCDVKRAYDEFIRSLVVLIHNIQVCISPETVVLGGGLSRVERLLTDIEDEQKLFYKKCNVPETLHSRIVRSKYLDECNLLGAMYNFLKRERRI